MNVDAKFMNRATFSKMVDSAVFEHKMSYMDAIIFVCDAEEIDPLDVKKFVSIVIRGKLEAEAMELNFIAKQDTLTLE